MVLLTLFIVLFLGKCAVSADTSGSAPYISRPDLLPAILNVSKYEANSTSNWSIFLSPWGSNVLGSSMGPHIFNSDGSLIWSGYGNIASMVMNFRPFDYSNDSKISFFTGVTVNSGIGMGRYAIMDNHYTIEKRLGLSSPFLHDLHEFQMTGENTAAFTTYQPVPYDFTGNFTDAVGEGWVYQNVAIEIDMTTDEILFQWNSLEHVPISDSMVLSALDSEGFDDGTPFDYMHMNSIQKDEQGNYLISSRHIWSLFYVNGTDGSVIWTMSSGNATSDWDINEDAKFAFQHHARFVSAESIGLNSQTDTRYMTVFDNEASEFTSISTFQPNSRGILLKLQEYTDSSNSSIGRVSLLLELSPPSDNSPSSSQGSVQVLPNGNFFVGWGSEPAMSEFDSSGVSVFEARFSDNSYRAFKGKWSASPLETIAISAQGFEANGSTALAVSWNGATDVSSYDLYGGNSSHSLARITNLNKTSFEDKYLADSLYKFVKVEALAINGSVLGNNTAKVIQFPLSSYREEVKTSSSMESSQGASTSSSNEAPSPTVRSAWLLVSLIFGAL